LTYKFNASVRGKPRLSDRWNHFSRYYFT